MATYPLYLLDINYIWEQLNTLSLEDDLIDYSKFISHFKTLPQFAPTLKTPNNNLETILDLKSGYFIKNNTFDIFNFKAFCL